MAIDSTTLEDLILQQLLSGQGQANPYTDISQVLGGAAGGRLAGQTAQADIALRGGALQKSLYDAALNRALAGAVLPTYRANQAELGDLLANTQDVGVNAPPALAGHLTTFTGGRRPSALGPNARAAGAALSNIGASNIGKDVLPQVPSMPNLPTGSVVDALLGGGATATGILGALAKYAKPGSFLSKLISGGTAADGSVYGGTAADVIGGMGETPVMGMPEALPGAMNEVPPLSGTTASSAEPNMFQYGLAGLSSGPTGGLDPFYMDPTQFQNPANPNAAAFGGAPIGGSDQPQPGWTGRAKAF
jgi:hypothetical protein